MTTFLTASTVFYRLHGDLAIWRGDEYILTATEATGAGTTGLVGKKIITDWGSLQANLNRLGHYLTHAPGFQPFTKSKFPMGTDILKIISAAEKVMPWPQTNGNLVRFVNAPNIGLVTVITDASNRLVTMFPGFSYNP